jgi:hypothetical protein
MIPPFANSIQSGNHLSCMDGPSGTELPTRQPKPNTELAGADLFETYITMGAAWFASRSSTTLDAQPSLVRPECPKATARAEKHPR